MSPEAFFLTVLVIVGLFAVAIAICDLTEKRAARRERMAHLSGDYPHSHVIRRDSTSGVAASKERQS